VRSERTSQRRIAILVAAKALFLEHGYEKVSVDDVAARAESSKGTIYQHFDSKAALFVTVVLAMTSQAADRVQADMPDSDTHDGVVDALMGHGRRLLNVVLTPELLRLRRLVISEAVRFPELGSAFYEGGPRKAIAELATALQRWTTRGLLDDRFHESCHNVGIHLDSRTPI
jgi:TetR/AcrR family transcriptional regulator, mexJK operon transcriptional repressor